MDFSKDKMFRCMPKKCCPSLKRALRGPIGPQGNEGVSGLSAYQIAVEHGFEGTEEEWLESLKGPFLSSFLEATASGQTIETGQNVVFNVDDSEIDIAGQDITVDSTGCIFTLHKAGLYHVEWSMNVVNFASVGLMSLSQNGVPSSVLSNIGTLGNYSSGALINVTADDLPMTISLQNLGAETTIGDNTGYEGTAAGIRILRFADGPN